MFCTEYR